MFCSLLFYSFELDNVSDGCNRKLKFIFKTLMAACSILFCKMFGNRFVQLTVFSQPYPADKIGNKTRVQQRRDAFKKNDVRTSVVGI